MLFVLPLVACRPVEAPEPAGTRTIRAHSVAGDDVSVSLTGKDDAYVMKLDGREVGTWQRSGQEWIYGQREPVLVLHAGGEVAIAGCRTQMRVDHSQVVDKQSGTILYRLTPSGELTGELGSHYGLRLEPYPGDPELGFLLILPLIHVIGRGEGSAPPGCSHDPRWPG